jgi:radical SAM protein with 4Fe4S-binding SPASM domain
VLVRAAVGNDFRRFYRLILMTLSLKDRVQTILQSTEELKPPVPGLYHFLLQTEQGKTRLHLRVEPDGKGLLLINAARALHLNPTATEMAYYSISDQPPFRIHRTISRRYQVSHSQARSDYTKFSADLADLIKPDGACPICELELDTVAPFSSRPSAPYRMDLAITYRCNNNCSHCYNARPRQYPELSTSEWKKIIDGLWKIGVPHIVFTGGEPTLRDDLPELIAYAENLGQITGINTNGRRLKDPAFLESLIKAGLDHIQITLESHDPTIHNRMVAAIGAWQETVTGIQNAVASHLYIMTNTTLLAENSLYLRETLNFLAELKVSTVGLNALIYSGRGEKVGTGLAENKLPPLLDIAREMTASAGQRLIWYTPTQYCHFDPILLDLGVKGCTAALYNMCIEPDGAVLPCQSYYTSLGNLLTDPWDSIWNHSLSVSLRERTNVPVACQTCAFLTECGGGCPLTPQSPIPPTAFATHPARPLPLEVLK